MLIDGNKDADGNDVFDGGPGSDTVAYTGSYRGLARSWNIHIALLEPGATSTGNGGAGGRVGRGHDPRELGAPVDVDVRRGVVRVVERAAADEEHLWARVLAEHRHLARGAAVDALGAAVVARDVDGLRR
jgi:hypothetical protein